jgi:hypothetical protein
MENLDDDRTSKLWRKKINMNGLMVMFACILILIIYKLYNIYFNIICKIYIILINLYDQILSIFKILIWNKL